MFAHVALYGALVGTALGGAILWDGRFNNMTSSTELDDFTDYVNLGADFGNPADSGSNKGVKITIDNSSVWNSDNMLRTELIPQTSAAINSGEVFYHFSMQHTGVNPPSAYEEHQVCFFESHFTEMKYGLISGEQGTLDTTLQWYANSASQWSVNFTAGIWHNIAYAIDFDASTSNGADWHLGVLRLPSSTGRSDTAAEDWYFSGVYIETGDLTTFVSGPGGSASSAVAASSAASSTTAAAASSSSAVASPSTAAATTASTVVAAASAGTTSATSVSSAVPTTLQTVAKTSSSSVVELTSTVTVVPVASASASASTAEASSAAASAAVTTSSAAAASASATATAAAADVDVTTASSLIPVTSSTSAAASTSAPASSPAGAATASSSAAAAVETEGECKVVYVYADEL
ncbi:hypothetical protein M8818_004488 [Zalaria obscura]|uniref:Uncharacterized protein n=1 Tax=Zalaria obscura TaxID=2024903 RepID=A0ACC3SC63_9PEZI